MIRFETIYFFYIFKFCAFTLNDYSDNVVRQQFFQKYIFLNRFVFLNWNEKKKKKNMKRLRIKIIKLLFPLIIFLMEKYREKYRNFNHIIPFTFLI